jgi:hypothetical protein
MRTLMKNETVNKYLNRLKRVFRILFLFCIIVLCTDHALADEKFRNLFPSGNGSDIVNKNCTVCHSSQIVLQNNMTRKRWDETITVMQKKHGLWYLGPEVRNQILNYLSNFQGITGGNSEDKTFKTYRYEYKPNPLQK